MISDEMQITCKSVRMAGVHSHLQSQALSFPLRHLGSFSLHMEEQDEPTYDLSTGLEQTVQRVKNQPPPRCAYGAASVLVALIHGIQLMQKSYLINSSKPPQQGFHIPPFPPFSRVYQGLAGVLSHCMAKCHEGCWM